ncbi:hypothetical protein D9613_010527 [Agrocybe pediades]|uniref:Hydrophobin n=1 Tax=Agrocybe pediades TaxID=84607 RepID=A0A8H4VHZ9_9AGAR|nr:hypothetical protein D9613_010527 [Agrocybe pediades]
MFSTRVAVFIAASMAMFAAASPAFVGDIHDSCATGEFQCCDQIFDSDSEQGNWLAGLIGATVGAVTAQVGVSCVPVTVIGVGSGGQCQNQPVCCTQNPMNGLIVAGCNPIGANV